MLQRYGKANEHNGQVPRDHWLEDWEKEKYKNSGAVARAMFVNKYKGMTFYLPDTEETYHVVDDGIQFLRGQSGGWTI
mgnify:CR=1 FL=1